MFLTRRYGKVRVTADPGKPVPLREVVDDVLGLRVQPNYLGHLFWLRYGAILLHEWQPDAGPLQRQELPRTRAETVKAINAVGRMTLDASPEFMAGMGLVGGFVLPELFPHTAPIIGSREGLGLDELAADGRALLTASGREAKGEATIYGRAAAQLRRTFEDGIADAALGRLSPSIAGHLARVEMHHNGVVRVPDLAAMAAWSLNELLRAGPIKVAKCEGCGLLWLPPRRAPYCRRPGLTADAAACRTLANHRIHLERHPDYYRERKRLYEQTRRGSLNIEEYQSWLAENRPGEQGVTWNPYAGGRDRRRSTAEGLAPDSRRPLEAPERITPAA